MIKELGFEAKNLKNYNFTNATAIDTNEIDLIFFDNEKDNIGDEEIQNVINLYQNKTKFTYFGSRHVNQSIHKIVSPSANSHERLNSNLLSKIKSS